MKIILKDDILVGNINPLCTCYKNNPKILKKICLKHENAFYNYGSIVKISNKEYYLYYRCISDGNKYVPDGDKISIDNTNNINSSIISNMTKLYTQSFSCIIKIDNDLNIVYPCFDLITDENLDKDFNNAILKENCASHNLTFFNDDNPKEHKKFKGIGGLVFDIDEIKDLTLTGFDPEYLNSVPIEKANLRSLHMNASIVLSDYADKYKINGLYLYESINGINFNLKKDTPIIGGIHDGLLPMRNGFNEFDSNICCFFWKKFNKYFLYTRINISNGKRFIQVTTSKNLIKWKNFKLISLEPSYKFTFAENYYSYNFFTVHDGEYLMAHLPCCTYTELTLPRVINNKFKLFISKDGFDFENIIDINIDSNMLYYPVTGAIKNNNIINICQIERMHIDEFMKVKRQLEPLWDKFNSKDVCLTYEELKKFIIELPIDIKNSLTKYHINNVLYIFRNYVKISFEQLIVEIYKFINCIVNYEIDENELSYLYTNDNTEKYVTLKDLYKVPSRIEVNCNIENNGYIIFELQNEIFNEKRLINNNCITDIIPGLYNIKIYLKNARLNYIDGIETVNIPTLYNAIQYTLIKYDDFHFNSTIHKSICDPCVDDGIIKKNAIQVIIKKLEFDNVTKLKGGIKFIEFQLVQSIKLKTGEIKDIILNDDSYHYRICYQKLVKI